MLAANFEPQPDPAAVSPACTLCAYWKRVVVDCLLELAAAREQLTRIDEDLVELIGTQRHVFYKAIGGTLLTEGAFRAKARHELRTGEHP